MSYVAVIRRQDEVDVIHGEDAEHLDLAVAEWIARSLDLVGGVERTELRDRLRQGDYSRAREAFFSLTDYRIEWYGPPRPLDSKGVLRHEITDRLGAISVRV